MLWLSFKHYINSKSSSTLLIEKIEPARETSDTERRKKKKKGSSFREPRLFLRSTVVKGGGTFCAKDFSMPHGNNM